MARPERLRTFVLSLSDGTLPGALLSVLRDEVVLAGTFRGAGLIEDAEIATITASGERSVHRVPGASLAIALEGTIGALAGDVGCSLRAVLAPQGPGGAAHVGELVTARVRALECTVTAFDDASLFVRQVAGITLVDTVAPSVPAAPEPAKVEPRAAAPSAPMLAPPSEPAQPALPDAAPAAPAVAKAPASDPALPGAESDRPRGGMLVPTGNTSMPTKPVRKQSDDEDDLYPEAGDLADHFAFGRSEIIKSDGERLLLRSREGRVKEIALEMLKVTLLPDEGGKRVFRLARRL
jgi:hypothetical protein